MLATCKVAGSASTLRAAPCMRELFVPTLPIALRSKTGRAASDPAEAALPALGTGKRLSKLPLRLAFDRHRAPPRERVLYCGSWASQRVLSFARHLQGPTVAAEQIIHGHIRHCRWCCSLDVFEV